MFALTLDFGAAYAAEKRRRSRVDFSDLEHMTAQLLTDDDGDTLRPTQAPSAAESPLDEEDVTLADYVGVWEYDTAYAWLAIDGDGNWMTVDGNGEIAETGTVEEWKLEPSE